MQSNPAPQEKNKIGPARSIPILQEKVRSEPIPARLETIPDPARVFRKKVKSGPGSNAVMKSAPCRSLVCTMDANNLIEIS